MISSIYSLPIPFSLNMILMLIGASVIIYAVLRALGNYYRPKSTI